VLSIHLVTVLPRAASKGRRERFFISLSSKLSLPLPLSLHCYVTLFLHHLATVHNTIVYLPSPSPSPFSPFPSPFSSASLPARHTAYGQQRQRQRQQLNSPSLDSYQQQTNNLAALHHNSYTRPKVVPEAVSDLTWSAPRITSGILQLRVFILSAAPRAPCTG
jgi:hypothetical protein